MTRERKAKRDLKIIEFRKTHTLFMTALKFDLSTNQIWRIEKEWKQRNGLLQ